LKAYAFKVTSTRADIGQLFLLISTLKTHAFKVTSTRTRRSALIVK
jgi:hypothetical protein